jgi:hypothetical protein
MLQPKQDRFDNSAKNYQLHEYIDRDRTLPLLQSQLTYASAGHLLETYVDALHVALLMDEPSFLIKLRDSPDTIRNPTFIRASHRLPPPYVIGALGNYLESPSFFVKHTIGEPGEPTRQDLKQPSATQFAHEIHGQLRQAGIRFTEKVGFSFYPPRGSGHALTSEQWSNIKRYAPIDAVAQFKQAIDTYKKLFQNFSKNYRLHHFDDSDSSLSKPISAEQKKLTFDAFETSRELAQYNTEIQPIIKKLTQALCAPALESIFVEYNKQVCQIENNQLNPKFPLSNPALLFNALGYVGRHQIDRTFFPEQAFYFQLSVIGVESSVSDNIERLNRHISQSFSAANQPLDDDILFPSTARQQFVDSISSHLHGIKFLHLFHRTAGILNKIYPAEKRDIAFQDMTQLLCLIGADTEVTQLNNPKEAATLIFALERRMRATDRLKTELYNTVGMLLNKAEHLGKKASFTVVPQKLKTDILGYLELLENHVDIQLSDKRAITPALILLRKSLTLDQQPEL